MACSVQVVTGGLGQGPVLPPSAQPPVDQARIEAETNVRADAHAFHRPGAKAFDQSIGLLDQRGSQRPAFRPLEVHHHRSPAATREGVAGRAPHPELAQNGPIQAHHAGAEIGENHAAHRQRSDSSEFKDFDPLQWSHAVVLGGARRLAGRPFIGPCH